MRSLVDEQGVGSTRTADYPQDRKYAEASIILFLFHVLAQVEVMLVDLGDKNSRDILAACIMRPDGLVNRCDFVMFLRGLWKVKGPRTVDLALEAMRKKRSDANLTENIMAHYVNPDELYRRLGELFDLWDADHNGNSFKIKLNNCHFRVFLLSRVVRSLKATHSLPFD
jgi:hypothetical protein